MKKIDIIRWALMAMGFLLYALPISSQVWQRTYSASNIEGEVVQTPDGGFLATFANGSAATKVDAFGEPEWSYSLPGIVNHVGSGLAILPDGNYLVAGNVWIGNDNFFFLSKLAPSGSPLWERLFAASVLAGSPTQLAVATDGFYISGESNFLLKTDFDGNAVWQFEGDEYSAYSLAPASGGGVVMVVQWLLSSTPSDLVLRKINPDGSIAWTKAHGTLNERGRGISPTSDGGFLAVAQQWDSGPLNIDFFVVKTDADGNLQWSKRIGLPDFNESPTRIFEVSDGSIMVAGGTFAFNYAHMTLLKLDGSGNQIWSKNYGRGETMYASENADNGFILFNNNYQWNNIQLIRTDSDGEVFQNTITGRLVNDLSQDCSFQTNEPGLGGWEVWANSLFAQVVFTDANGNFELSVDTGAYTISIVPPSSDWTNCNPPAPISFSGTPESIDIGEVLMQFSGAPMLTWQKGYPNGITFGEVEPTPDGGFFCTGAAAFKTDGQGNVLWSHSLPTNYSSQAGQSVEVLPDGNYLVVGQAHVTMPAFENFLFMTKLSPAGNVIWEQFHPAGNSASTGGPFLVSQIAAGGFYVAGQYGFLLKTDADGNIEWQVSGGSRGLQTAGDGGAVVLVNDNTTGSPLLFMRKHATDGSLIWSQAYVSPNSGDLVGRQMAAIADGGFAVTGFNVSGNDAKNFILKIDADGNQQWLKLLDSNGSEVGQAIHETQNGDLLVTGWDAFSGRYVYLSRLDAQGNLIWKKRYMAGEGMSVKELPDGSIISYANNTGVNTSHLIKTDSQGSVFQNLIKGNVADDVNNDCVFQVSDTGLENWAVHAFGTFRATAFTDADGNFEIAVDTGSYTVGPQLPEFVWQPCENTEDVTLNNFSETVNTDPFLMQEVTATMTTISGYVYQDLDGDCEQDANEPPLANCLVWAAEEQNFGTGQYQTTTDANGFYSFDLPAGEYYYVGLADIFNNPLCSPCGNDFSEYVDAVPVANNIGLQCTNGSAQHLTGYVFFDENENCQLDIDENGLAGWAIKVVEQGTSDTLIIDGDVFSTGEFSVPVGEGIYTLVITPPNYLFLPCQTVQTVQVSASGTPPVMFPLMPLATCPKMTVDVGTAFLQPCTESTYHVQYCNEGTGTAEGVSIEINLPPDLVFGASQLPATPLLGNGWSFVLGNVDAGVCHDFWFNATLDCDSEVGLTHCVEAHVFPDSLCTGPMAAWDGSSVELFAECMGDSVVLTIANSGWGDMSQPLEFIVVEDNVLIRDSSVQLESGNFTNVVVYPNGATIVMQAQQAFGHPGNSAPVVFVEGCGGDSISIGFVTQYPPDDGDCFVDIDCRESVAAFDPNIKEAQPRGITDAHFIRPETALSYQVTFQNLGTAAAQEVVILDTLSQMLDVESLRPGVASHPYTWELLPGNILRFVFENINLPQQAADPDGSIGFVKYHIAQTAGNVPGTLIENRAGIYFDFNAPVITNTVSHRIPEPEMFDNQTAVLCAGEPYGGQVFTENTILSDTVRYAFFDSIFNVEINVLPVFESQYSDAICGGEVYPFNGDVLMEAGVYTAVLQNENGCDSTVTLSLEVYPDQSMVIDTALVVGGEIFGVAVFSDTTFTQNMVDENGCNYMLTLNVETVVATSEKLNDLQLQILPNPNDGRFLLKGKLPQAGSYGAAVYNAFGQQVAVLFSDEYFNKTFEREVRGALLSPGVYYLVMSGEGGKKAMRLVVF